MANLSGKWSYSEDFGMGNSSGEVILFHDGNTLTAEFVFTEKVDNGYEIRVEETAIGEIIDGKAILESSEVNAWNKEGELVKYLPNNFEINIMSETKIVGSTYDQDLVCGVFIMNKI